MTKLKRVAFQRATTNEVAGKQIVSPRQLITKFFGLGVLCASLGVFTSAQTATSVPISVNSRLVMDAAGPEQRQSINAIYVIVCPDTGFGSGFYLKRGIMVTNSHVVATCTEQNLVAISAANEQVRFSRVITDKQRDLALLIPTEKLPGGFRLALNDAPVPGTEVSTWGYPFGYNGISPLLSVGYVSGYREDTSSGRAVKHIVVNGAFNHGNSGGPLLIANNNEVIGLVVLTFNFYPPGVKKIIDNLSNQHSGLIMGNIRISDGSMKPLSEAQLTGAVLNKFYENTQVMIGEAVAGSELATMLKEHSSELPTTTLQSKNVRGKSVGSTHLSHRRPSRSVQ